MTTPAQKSKYDAQNEYVCAQVERHGACRATRDEAWRRVDEIHDLVKAAVRLVGMELIESEVEDAVENIIPMILSDPEERRLASSMIPVACEP